MADQMRAELVNQALAMALCQRQPAAGLIMHTDRGSQYGADSYRQLLTQHGIQPSMSRKGNCWDNAVAESFLHTLKTELVYLEGFDTHEYAQTAWLTDKTQTLSFSGCFLVLKHKTRLATLSILLLRGHRWFRIRCAT